MACNLTLGRLVDCKDQIGGLKKIFFVNTYSADIRAGATFSDNVMTTAGFVDWDIYGGTYVNVFQYDLRPNLSSMTVNINSDPATGTTWFEQTLSVTLQKLTAAQSNELKLISYNRSQVFVLDANDNVFLLGMNDGVDVLLHTALTGAAKSDLTGYTLELRAEEADPLIWLPATAGPGTAKYPFDGLSDEDKLNITVGT